MTGLSGAGKSTLANALEQEFNKMGKHTYILDGDNLRHGLNSDLGFSEADHNENEGLYEKARRGEVKDFTGIDSPYQAHENPEVVIRYRKI